MPLRLREHYDWIVLGDHPGALLSGCMAARLGFSVLVLPVVPSVGRIARDNGDCLDPEPNFLLGLGRDGDSRGLLEDCLARLDVPTQEVDRLRLDGVWPTIGTPKVRFELFPDEERFQRELVRELTADGAREMGLAPAFGRFVAESRAEWERIPERFSRTGGTESGGAKKTESLKERWKRLEREFSKGPGLARFWFRPRERSASLAVAYDRRLRSGFLSKTEIRGEDLRQIIRSAWFGIVGSDREDPSLPEALQALALARTGAGVLGGMTAFRQYLVVLARRFGAHVPQRAECRKLFAQDGKFVGVQAALDSRPGSMIGAGAGVVGCSLAHVREFLPDGAGSWFRRLRAAPVPGGWRFTLGLLVDEVAIPDGVTTRFSWAEAGAPPLEAEIAHPAHFGLRHDGRKVIFLRTILPFSQESLGIAEQRSVAARMFRWACGVFPFLEGHVVRIFPDFRDPVEWEKVTDVYGFALPQLIPENLRVYVGNGVGASSGLDGLFVASGESYPFLGSMGGWVASLESMSWLARKTGLSGAFG